MGILTIANMCSHVQNASRAKLGITSVPPNKFNLSLAVALHRQGLLSHVYRGGPTPPDPETIETCDPEPVTHANVASRRLWLGLKYYNNQPVLRTMRAVSTPKRHITIDLRGLESVAHGVSTKRMAALTLGECLFVGTDFGVLEAREAIARRRGGLVLCRTS